MDSDSQNPSIEFKTNATGTNENIINLDRKLRGLRAEVSIQIQNFSFYEGEDKDLYMNQLSLLAQELDDAIKGIETLVSVVAPESEEYKQAFYQSEEMQQFNEMIIKNLKKMEHMHLKF